jgi:Fe-S oxidoreductase
MHTPPRDSLKIIPVLELVEMDRNGEMTYCCGPNAISADA